MTGGTPQRAVRPSPGALEWASFYAWARPSLVRYLAAAGDGPADPEDLAQDALLIMSKHLWRFRDPDQALAFCFTIGARLGIRAVKYGYGRRESPLDHHALDAAAPPGDLNIESEAVIEAYVQDVLGRLSADHRRILLLARADVSPDEIAALMNLTPAAAKQKLYRARLKFREQLDADNAEAARLGAVVPFLARLRGTRRWAPLDVAPAAYSPATSFVAGAVALTLVTALQGPANGAGRSTPPGPPAGRVARAIPPGVGERAEPGPHRGEATPYPAWAAGRRLPADPARVVGLVIPAPYPSLPKPTGCTPVCVGDRHQAGDTVTVTLLGDHGPAVTEDKAPVCEYVPDNPAARCTRQEPDHWAVKDVPPPPTGGTTP